MTAPVPPPEEIEHFWQHVADLEQAHGVELTDEGKVALTHEIAERGFSPEVTAEVIGEFAAEGSDDYAGAEEADYAVDTEDGPVDQDVQDLNVQNFITDAATELGRLQQRLGRTLAPGEGTAIGERMAEDAHRFGKVDAQAAFEAHYAEQGRNVPDPLNRLDRHDRIAERLEHAAQAEEAAEPPDLELLNRDDHDGRVARMAHRLDGGEFEYVDEDG